MKRLSWFACLLALGLLLQTAQAQMDSRQRLGLSPSALGYDARRPELPGREDRGAFPSLTGEDRDRSGDPDLEALKAWQTRRDQADQPQPVQTGRERSRRERTSSVERAYRLQYSETLIDQMTSLEDLDFLDEHYNQPWADQPEEPGRYADRSRFDQPDEGPGDGRDQTAPRQGKDDAGRERPGSRSGGRAVPDKRLSALGDERQLLPESNARREWRSREDRPASGQDRATDRDADQYAQRRDRAQDKAEKRKRSFAKIIESQLTQFGYDFFEASEFLPKKNIAPDAAYVIGPGDVLRVKVWGNEVDAEFSGKVQADGTIILPRLGVLPIAGTPYGGVNELLTREVKKYVQGVNVHAVLEDLRDIQVYVAGQVAAPGLKYVPAFSTVLTALGSAQGPLKSGSLRHIQIYRGGRLHRELDLYDLITGGDAKGDILLADRDVIHVPYLGPTVAVVGAVVRPGIFELRSAGSRDATAETALRLAGNVLGQSAGQAYLRGYENGSLRSRAFACPSPELAHQPLAGGELIEARFASGQGGEYVRLLGHVWDKTERQYQPGLTLSQVLGNPLNVKPGAVSEYGVIRRYSPLTASFSTVRFPLSQTLEGRYDMPLEPRDRVYVLSRQELGIKEEVSVTGGVWNPGVYDWEPGMTVSSLVARAGGLKFGSLPQSVELSRQYAERNVIQTRHSVLDMNAAPAPLQPFDAVHIPIMNDAGVIRQVEIVGQVRYPGVYAIQEGEHLSDLIERAGGFLPDAYYFGAKFTSRRAQRLQQKSLDNLVSDLETRVGKAILDQAQTSVEGGQNAAALAAASKASVDQFLGKLKSVKAEGRVSIVLSDLASLRNSEYDLLLEDGDRLETPRRPNFVSVVGSVYTPNSFNYQPTLTVDDYLRRSGGPTKTADQDHMYLLKANGEVFSMAQGGMFSGSFGNAKLMPGDTIVVPENLERVPWLRTVRDITDIVFKIATTAGIAIAVL